MQYTNFINAVLAILFGAMAIFGAVSIGVFMGLQGLANGNLAVSIGLGLMAFLAVTLYSLSASTIIIGIATWRHRHKVKELIQSPEVPWWRKLSSGAPGAMFLSVFAFVSLFVTGPAIAGFGIVFGMVVPKFARKWWKNRTVSAIDLLGVGLILLGGVLVAVARGAAGLSLDVMVLLGWLAVVVASALVAWQFDTLAAMTRAVNSARASAFISSATGAMWAGVFLAATVAAMIMTHQPLIPAGFSLPANPLYYMGPAAALGIIPIGARVAPLLDPVVKPILTNAGIILMTVVWEWFAVPHTPLSQVLLGLACACAVIIVMGCVRENRRPATTETETSQPAPAT